ncbi:MAG: 2-succinyl-5-enolpyruvyl-6-hydroxy-3-cyclohexene-1-carboxylic-acid synthase [Bacteroidia bacterium]|nr:2-succinyl-5-enolpyruvyl-6-hydroxy-3-cyclohexene-1-carboxylic-acid synthase [Bacteroidia bacterium]
MQSSINNLVSHIYALGVRHALLCPGNRNAQITLSFANHKGFKCYSIVDERSAAFTALGIASYIKFPVVVVCTSGTAVLNFYPAIAEAFYSQIPLIIITADRLPNLIDQWEGQTIRQNQIYEKHILASYSYGFKDVKSFDFEKNLLKCVYPVKGPIHINIPLDEPHFEKSQKFHFPKIKKYLINKEQLECKIPNVILPQKIIVFAGADADSSKYKREFEALSKQKNIVLLADILSGLHNVQNIKNWDVVCNLSSNETIKSICPDLLITIGKFTVSKSFKLFIKQNKPKAHWHITANGTIADPYQTNPVEVKCYENLFLKYLINETKKSENKFFNKWLEVSHYFDKKSSELFKPKIFNEFSVTKFIIENTDKNSSLYLSNGMPIRYASYLSGFCKDFKIFGNRGTSGIDGISSSAAGVSMANKNKTILITGDISFFYDINGLWNKYLSKNFKIVVFNNNGGGIFRLINGPDEKLREEYLSAGTGRNCISVAESFGITYFSAKNYNELNLNFKKFIGYDKSPAIFEVFFKKNNMIKFYNDFNNINKK